MIRIALLALCLSSGAAMALGPKDQLLANVTLNLPRYVQGVDTSTLTRGQLAAILMIMDSRDRDRDKASMIRSVLGGPNTLRGLLFN